MTTLGRKLADRMQAVNAALEQDDLAKLIPRYVTLDLQPTQYDAAAVKEVRARLRVPQRVFAVMLGVSVNTVRAWEQGVKTPSQMACRFMDRCIDDVPAALSWLRKIATKTGA